jgi:iron-sulfur cluster assembly accessory protein
MIDISERAVKRISDAVERNVGKSPRIILKNVGCAGARLFLVLSESCESDAVVEACGIKLAISSEAIPFSRDLSIDVVDGLSSEIVIINNEAKRKCKCGKSFSKLG